MSGKNVQAKILIVDDEEYLCELLKDELLSTNLFEVDIANDGAQAINKIQSKIYDVVLLDIKMPRISGIEVLKFIKEYSPDTELIMITALGDIKLAVETIKLGAFDFITKPYNFDELLVSIQNALEKRQLKLQNILMQKELSHLTQSDEIIGQSKVFKDVLDIVARVAGTDTTVLIYGESGTGKEVIARLIHKNSLRKDKPFVTINCAAIPDTLLESELFGYEKGAFTDAHTSKPGLVEIANGGTLFLDEIGDLSQYVQPKLLRFIETGEFRRVGGNNILKVDVRIISATNKDLNEEVKKGNFREDLLYRLNVVTIRLPALRERKEDIPLLVEYFLNKKTRGRKKISPEAMQILINYDWPGNIRELENVVERAAILAKDDIIKPEDLALKPELKEDYYAKLMRKPVNTLSLAELEKIHIENVLKANNWNKSKTAEILGISLKTLYLKLKRYGISEPF
ncbi:sigma-54-dependent transcriptional regulator [Candidatus Kryptonium thompsonii]|uniref:sigma-54-dependent transcriptional regulator n=1 Tax=Candidatus Kryptonium thompsonii TaxID=1633631 RepID=UPI000707ECAB|nr:sigma-54 dependent transcriptional regulator [Candidatus Kryptonium thompsoni]CUS77830.1 DNA-binding transcriptional response regulator, NtrC family, contains REC, AAA-type ATPase, and a Fis-type DNA-binding domains [Candidatus Kryptonium thompsoni]